MNTGQKGLVCSKSAVTFYMNKIDNGSPRKSSYQQKKTVNIFMAKHVLALINGGRNLTTEMKKRI